MDPAGGLPQFSAQPQGQGQMGEASGSAQPFAMKPKKSKKHKKHHRHDADGNGGVSGGGGGAGAGGGGPEAEGLKLKIRFGTGDETSPSAHKKKKKKKEKEKKRDKGERKEKHKHHHKEKRKRELAGSEAVADDGEPARAKAKLDEDKSEAMDVDVDVSSGGSPSSKDTAGAAVADSEKEKSPVKSKPLYKLLDYLLPQLKKRDTHNFFALPVEDKFAPGYSQIIKQPMDLSTIRSKLDAGQYTKLDFFRDDFKLMCTNAMTYNTQETIYYKTAKKLLQIGTKLLTPEKLILMREQLHFMNDLTEEELGFDINEDPSLRDGGDDDDDDDDDDDGDVSRVIEDIREVVRRPPGRFEANPDDMTSAEILEQAKKAASGAADKLKLYKPKTQMGFLRQKPDGTTSLSFLTGSDGILPGTQKDRPVNLGSLIGKVKQGTGSISGFAEDRRNLVKPVHPIHYNAFSTHGPSYDSTFANLTKEETDLVYSTYGDEVGVQYAESILNYSRNCDFAMLIVDNLLDILTGNEHRKTSQYIREKKMLRREDDVLDKALQGVEVPEEKEEDAKKDSTAAKVAGDSKEPEPKKAKESESQEKPDSVKTEVKEEKESEEDKAKIDFDSLKSLADDGIDMSFLDSLKTRYQKEAEEKANQPPPPPPMTPQEMLDANAALLEHLKQVQMDRLSQAPPHHFSNIPKAGDKEAKLATEITKNLCDMAKHLKPSNVAPVQSVRRLLGIPPEEDKEDQESEGASEEREPENSNTGAASDGGNAATASNAIAAAPLAAVGT